MGDERVVAVIQARMKSSRLPGKVLREIDGVPMLQRVIDRMHHAVRVDQIVVATTDDPSDNPVAEFCHQRGYDFFRGHMRDVLDRYYQAARFCNAQVVVRITADCPLIDPYLVDELVSAFQGSDAAPGRFDFGANRLPPPFRRTYPIGLDAEVCTFSALERAWLEADEPFHREHVMPYFYEGIGEPERIQRDQDRGYFDIFESPRNFRVLLMNHHEDYGKLRWTVDTTEDLLLVERIVKCLQNNRNYRWQDLLKIVFSDPENLMVNTDTYHKDFHESEQGSAWKL